MVTATHLSASDSRNLSSIETPGRDALAACLGATTLPIGHYWPDLEDMKDDETVAADAQPSGSEILDFVLLALDENPQRLDLWMMRFEIVRSLALKDSFIEAMQRAYGDTHIRRGLDWQSIRRMWDELAPNDPVPDGVKLPPSPVQQQANNAPLHRRFSDTASELAAEALQALAAEYIALRQQPDYFKQFARATREHLNRPTPLQRARKLEQQYEFDGRILLKREDGLKNSPEREYAVAQSHLAKALGRDKLICANEVDGFAFELARAANQFGLELTVDAGTDRQLCAHRRA